jgi:hypothetical protein
VDVKVEVELTASLTEVDKEEMLGAARHLTNDRESVVVYSSEEPRSIRLLLSRKELPDLE